MKEVYPNLFVGGQNAIDLFSLHLTNRDLKKPGLDGEAQFYILSAAKEPWHRRAVGYTTRGAPKDDAEYLVARRPQRMALNLVDLPEDKADFISLDMLREGVDFIKDAVDIHNKPILVHCNQGVSRGPSLALMYLLKHTVLFKDAGNMKEVISFYRDLYPKYEPNGIVVKVQEFWQKDVLGID